MSDLELRTEPFRHAVLDGFWDSTLLDGVCQEFFNLGVEDPRWIRYDNEHEGKLHGDTNCWGEATRALLGEFGEFTPELSELFGIPELIMETVGGGMHLIPPQGRLDVHTDFNRSPSSGLYRRLNLMCYLNHAWGDEGGWLELHPDPSEGGEVVSYPPEFNRTVVFECSDRSWHGHPHPARRWRMSVAAYYFSPEPPEGYGEDHSTVWMFP